MSELWTNLTRNANIELRDSMDQRLRQYLDLLFQANQRMNLTRITDRNAAEVQHIGDALTILPHLPETPHRLADIGSGGGVPGIPLAIVRPDVEVVLIESTRKKAEFLRECVAAMGLANVSVRNERAEEAGRSELREGFEVVTARAVGELVWLAEWCLPLVRKGGRVLAMKGRKIVEELPAAARAIRTLGGGEAIIHDVELPGTDHRVIAEITKIGKTDSRYPRPATAAKGRTL